MAELYRCRWQIEVFFKQIKQTLQLCDFLGNTANAVRWQVWTALLLYVLLRFQAFLSEWPHSFTRLFAMIRGVVWDRIHLPDSWNSMGQPVTGGACAPSPNTASSRASPRALWDSSRRDWRVRTAKKGKFVNGDLIDPSPTTAAPQ